MEALGYLSFFADFIPPNLQIERIRRNGHFEKQM